MEIYKLPGSGLYWNTVQVFFRFHAGSVEKLLAVSF